MTNYKHIKNSYAWAVRTGMIAVNYEDAKHGNEIIHNFCKILVNSSNYTDSEKEAINRDLDSLKATLSAEIELFFSKEQIDLI